MTFLEAITHKHFFASVLIVLDIASAVRYCIAGDRGWVVYWLCAAGITYAATFMIKA